MTGQHAGGESKTTPTSGKKLVLSSVNLLCTVHVQLKIANTPYSFLVDTGAAVTLISENVWLHCLAPKDYQLQLWTHPRLTGVEGSTIEVLGKVEVPIAIDNHVLNVSVAVVRGISESAILGLDFLSQHSCLINLDSRILSSSSLQFSVPFMTGSPNHKPCSTVYAVLNMSISIPERSELEIIAELDTPSPQEQNYLVENSLNHNIIVARAVVQPAGHQTVLRLLNPNNESNRLYKEKKLAKLEPLPNSSVVSTVTTDNKSSPATSEHKQLLWHIAKNATGLNEEHQNQLYQFFLQYTDVVALSDDDLGQTDYVCHTIETGSAHPICQPP